MTLRRARHYRTDEKMNAELNTIIFSTHDTTIMSIADHVIRLLDGLVVEDTKAAAGSVMRILLPLPGAMWPVKVKTTIITLW